MLGAVGVAGCTAVEPSGPTPEPTYVRFVSVVPSASSVLNAGALVKAQARVFADHKYNGADLALYVQSEPGKLVNQPVFQAVPAGPGQYTLEQTFTVPANVRKVYLVTALYEKGSDDSSISAVTAWDVK